MKETVFFVQNVSRPSNPPDELAHNVSKKNPFRTNYSSIFCWKVQNLAVFSIIYMVRIRFFLPGELNQRTFSRYTVIQERRKRRKDENGARTGCGHGPKQR